VRQNEGGHGAADKGHSAVDVDVDVDVADAAGIVESVGRWRQ
jgi:hypothetical protein